MIFSRLFSLFLRFGEFVSSAVVLGLVAHFLHKGGPPHGREIYTLVVAAVSVVLSLVWMIPTTSALLHYPADFVISFAWFASFGALVQWLYHTNQKANCGGVFHWSTITQHSYCGEWKAAEAFAFISAVFFLASALLGLSVYHKLFGGAAAADGAPRRRWGRKSAV